MVSGRARDAKRLASRPFHLSYKQTRDMFLMSSVAFLLDIRSYCHKELGFTGVNIFFLFLL